MQRAFSLVELSIVLVILGLLTGGILSGQSLIRASELRGATTDLAKYTSATYAFRDKYFALPGDLSNAVKFWGRADGGADLTQNCAAPETDVNASNPAATCNGNGDGTIGGSGNLNTEGFRFWQHLSNAGLVEGQYTGVGGAMTAGWRLAIPGTNTPIGRLPNSSFFPRWGTVGGVCTAGYIYTSGSNRTTVRGSIFFGQINSNLPWLALIKPEEAWNIDTKLDDGRPAQGKVTSYCAAACATTTDTDTAEYAVTTNSAQCWMDMAIF